MSVKRWKANVDMWPDQAVGQLDVVKASDYDALAADAQRDYDGMREFQAKFIAADHRLRALEAALRPLAMAAKSWHDFHHDDAGFSAVQCDEICKTLPTALAVLTPSETGGEMSVTGRDPHAQGSSPIDLLQTRNRTLEAALSDIRQAIWTDEHGIERVDMGCIQEALASVAETGDPTGTNTDQASPIEGGPASSLRDSSKETKGDAT